MARQYNIDPAAVATIDQVQRAGSILRMSFCRLGTDGRPVNPVVCLLSRAEMSDVIGSLYETLDALASGPCPSARKLGANGAHYTDRYHAQFGPYLPLLRRQLAQSYPALTANVSAAEKPARGFAFRLPQSAPVNASETTPSPAACPVPRVPHIPSSRAQDSRDDRPVGRNADTDTSTDDIDARINRLLDARIAAAFAGLPVAVPVQVSDRERRNVAGIAARIAAASERTGLSADQLLALNGR